MSLLHTGELERPSRHSGPQSEVKRTFPNYRCQIHELVDLIPHTRRQGLRPCNPFPALPDQTSSPVVDPHLVRHCAHTEQAPLNLNTYPAHSAERRESTTGAVEVFDPPSAGCVAGCRTAVPGLVTSRNRFRNWTILRKRVTYNRNEAPPNGEVVERTSTLTSRPSVSN